jgi:hypothetical protein
MKQTIYSLRQEWLNKEDQAREARSKALVTELDSDFSRARVLAIEASLAYNSYIRQEKKQDRIEAKQAKQTFFKVA